MGRESATGIGRRSSGVSEQTYRSCKFGTIVRALWPDKPALNLAQRIGCSERAASFYISGQRKLSARAVAAIVAEIVE